MGADVLRFPRPVRFIDSVDRLGDNIQRELLRLRLKVTYGGWKKLLERDDLKKAKVYLGYQSRERAIAIMSSRVAERFYGAGWRPTDEANFSALWGSRGMVESALDWCDDRLLLTYCGDEVGMVTYADRFLEQLNALK